MPALLIRHKVTDIARWRPVFDGLEGTLHAHGCLGSQLFLNADNPKETLILLTWDDLERARLYAQSDDLREAMRQSGVADEPDLWFLDDAGLSPSDSMSGP
jgi:quinol monooxygenase YgiN